MALDNRIQIVNQVSLDHPTLIAAWPGMGLVGFNAVEFLRSTLGAQKVAEIDSTDFFAIQGIQVKDGIAVPLRVPTNSFHAWKNPDGGDDLLLFLGTAQPVSGRELALSNLVLEVAKLYGVKRLFTAAAMAAQIDHLAPSRVFGVTNQLEESPQLQTAGVQMLVEGEIGGLNGLLVGAAGQSGLPGACLMGEMPHYTTHIENPKASKAVLEILSSLLSIQLDLTPLTERARYIEAQIQSFLQAARAAAQPVPDPSEAGSAEPEAEELAEEPGSEEGGEGSSEKGGGGSAIN